MHREFADWVNDALTTTKSLYHNTLKAWDSAVSQRVNTANGPIICDLVALAFGSDPENVDSAEAFRNTIKTQDIGFRVKNNYALQVLSGAALLTLLNEEAATDKRFHLQCLAATAVVAASFDGTCGGYRPDALVQVASDFVNRQTRRRREIKRVTFKGDATALQQAQRRLRASAKTVNAPTTDQIKQFNAIVAPTLELLPEIPTLLRNQDILQEESEMAWWVLAGFSESTEQAFRNLNPAFLPIVVGYELAQRTRVYPAGVAARHLIGHVLHTAGQVDSPITLHALADNLSSDWAQSVLKTYPPVSATVTPVLHLVHEVSMRGAQWVKEFPTVTGIDQNSELHASHLGATFYQECLTTHLRRQA